MTRVNIFIILLLLASRLTAQDRDWATINYSISTVKYNDTSTNARQFDAKFKLPVYQKNKSTFAATIGYKNISLNNFSDNYTSSLHGFTMQAVWLYKFTGKKSLTFFTQAGLFSDMKDVSGKDFRYSAGFRYRYKHSDRLTTGWGLAYSRQFFGNQIIPFIDVDYRPNNKWSISGQVPVKPKILYHFNTKISAGIEVNGEAASYRLSATEKNNRFIQINQWTGLAKIEYQLAKSWQLNLGFGKHFKQSYKLYNDASTTSWTIITIPLGNKPEPVKKIDSKGLNIQLGVSFSPFVTKRSFLK